uniref:Uncharacterized protein n=1 Tax=Neogobius melanostomus TaxID=47308 RepID=A0A8C6TZM5_9GOBI
VAGTEIHPFSSTCPLPGRGGSWSCPGHIAPGRSQPIRVLSRLTIVMSDSSHYRASCPEYRPFDLLAVQPQTDKLFLSACMTYDVDIICISVSERLPFFYKRAPVYGVTIATTTTICHVFYIFLLKWIVKLLFGLSDRDGRDAVTTNCRAALLHGESRKTAGGIIRTFRRAEEQRHKDSLLK